MANTLYAVLWYNFATICSISQKKLLSQIICCLLTFLFNIFSIDGEGNTYSSCICSKNQLYVAVRKWSTTNWRFSVWLNITLKNNTILSKKLPTIVSLLHFGTRAYFFSQQLFRVVLHFSTRNNCCGFLGFHGVIIQSVIQSVLKTAVCGASLSHSIFML